MTGSTRRKSDRNDARWPPSVGRTSGDALTACATKLPRGRCGRVFAVDPDAWFDWITGARCAEMVPCPRCVGLHPLPRVEVLAADDSATVRAG